MAQNGTRQVKRRRMFYIPGYDPIHPRRYRELYRSEGADQAQISGYDLALSAKTVKDGLYGWNVKTVIDGQTCHTQCDVLVWSDIVRDSMETGFIGTYRQLVQTAWTYIASGALRRLMRLRAGPVIAALYPIVFLLLQLALALCCAVAIGWALSWITPWLSFVGLAVIPLVLGWFRKHDNRFFAYYLMHDYAYSAKSKGAPAPELSARMHEFADAIAEALNSDVDEVLVVGHSSGAHLGVSILADLVTSGRVSGTTADLSFLTLGQVVPMVSFLPDAWDLRRDLAIMGQAEHVCWVDVTAPADGCAFALCHPVAVSGVGNAKTNKPLVLSAAFSQTLSKARWSKIKRRFFRIHFQYMCAFDQPGDYDYFQISAGPRTLASRFKGRAPSPSRIMTPASKFTSTTP